MFMIRNSLTNIYYFVYALFQFYYFINILYLLLLFFYQLSCKIYKINCMQREGKKIDLLSKQYKSVKTIFMAFIIFVKIWYKLLG